MSTIISSIVKNDVLCFYALNRKFHCRQLNMLMKMVTHIGSTAFAVSVSLVCLIFNGRSGLILIINLISSQTVIHLLKRVIGRPRPYKTLGGVIAINPPKCKYSLPSGHSGSALSIALVLSSFFPSLKFVLIPIAISVGISRIYLGCHYPTDVLAGFAISHAIYKAMGYVLSF